MYRRRSRAPARKRSYRRYASLSDPTARREYLRQRAMGAIPRGGANSISTFGPTWAAATDDQKRQRLMTGFRGRGDYYSDKIKPFLQKWVPKGSLAAAGSSLGSLYGGSAGGLFGSTVGGAAANYLGWGDYSKGGSISTNQIVQGGSPPITVNAADDLSGDVYFSHREFVGNVTAQIPAVGSSIFTVVAYAINPGLATTFPWLSQIAQNWTMYEFEGLMFEYKPTSGEGAGTSNALGKVVMATNYDPSAAVFTSSPQMESYDYSSSTKPSEGLIHGVETKNSQQFGNMQYVRSGSGTTRDKIFTDIGLFQIATEGVSGPPSTNMNIGELWVTYRIKLSRANLYGNLLCFNQLVDQHYYQSSAANICGQTQTAQLALTDSAKYPRAPLNNIAAVRLGSNLGTIVSSTVTNRIRVDFPVNIIDGVFEVSLQQICPVGTTPTLTFVADSNCSRVLLPTGSCQPLVASANAGLVAAVTFYIRVTSPGSTFAFFLIDFSNAILASSNGYIKITCVNQALL